MFSKETLKKEFNKSKKRIISLKKSLENKNEKMIDLSADLFYRETKLTRDNASRYNNIKETARNLTNTIVKNQLFYYNQHELINETVNTSLTGKLLIKNLQEDKKVSDTKKKSFSRKFDTLNDDMIYKLTILDLEYAKLQDIYERLKAKSKSSSSNLTPPSSLPPSPPRSRRSN